jgi:guanylate kinase
LKPVREALSSGKLVIFDIDIQGHRLVRAKMNDLTTSAFITPPSISELEKRLRARETDSEDVILNRLKNAKEEIEAIGEYDFTIINDSVENASKEFIIVAKAAKLKHSEEDEEQFINQWLL